MKYYSPTQLTELNQKLQRSAQQFIEKTDAAKAKIQAIKDEVTDRYFGPDTAFYEVKRSERQQFADAEIRKRTGAALKEFNAESKDMLRQVGAYAEEIRAAAPLYEPIRRLNLETSVGEAARNRAAVQQLIDGASVPELETMLARFQATNDLPGLAALSSVVGRDAKLRKAMPNAKIVETVKFGDEDQLAAIFHAGQHMLSILLEEFRSVTGEANNRRINAGLRQLKVDDGKVVDTQFAPAIEGVAP